MTAQRRSISGAIKAAAQGGAAADEKPSATTEAPAPERVYRARSREGKRPISAPVDPAAKVTLKILSAETGHTQEDLIREAIRDLFTKHGKPPIA